MALAPSKSLVAIPTRPLNQGMRLDMPPNGMPPGSFLRLQNYRVPQYGIERRDGFIPFDTNNGPDQYEERMLDIIHFYTRSSEAETLLLTDKAFYKRIAVNHSERQNIEVDFTLIDNTASSANGVVSVDIDIPEDDYDLVRAGDTFNTASGIYDIVGYGAYSAVSPNATILIQADGIDAGDFVGTVYSKIRYNLHRQGNMAPTYSVLPNESADLQDRVLIADQADRGIYSYTPSGGLEMYPIDSSTGLAETPVYTNLVSARTITYYDDRVWVANTVEQDGIHTQRIRWSQPLNFDRFHYEDYIDLPYTEGACIALQPLGSLLVAYFEDSIYLGRVTNIAGRPLTFEPMETGNIGLIATKAITPFLDAHVFVGQDDIYTLSGSTALQPMNAPIIQESLEYTKKLDPLLMNLISVSHDQFEDTIVFIFPDRLDEAIPVQGVAERLWRYNYKTNAWSYDEVPFVDDNSKTTPLYLFSGISPAKTYLYGRSWQEWLDLDDPAYDPDTDSDEAKWIRGTIPVGSGVGEIPLGDTFDDYNTWYDLTQEVRKAKTLKIQVWHTVENKLHLVEEEEDTVGDQIGPNLYPIWALFETPDTDMNAPDTTKTVTRVTLKSFQNRSDRLLGTTAPLRFDIYASASQGWRGLRGGDGKRWKRRQSMVWPYTVNPDGTYVRSYNEGKVDIRATGSTFRFKCVGSELVPKWRLSEYVLLVTGHGLQIDV
jgi:hypothetical protein